MSQLTNELNSLGILAEWGLALIVLFIILFIKERLGGVKKVSSIK